MLFAPQNDTAGLSALIVPGENRVSVVRFADLGAISVRVRPTKRKFAFHFQISKSVCTISGAAISTPHMMAPAMSRMAVTNLPFLLFHQTGVFLLRYSRAWCGNRSHCIRLQRCRKCQNQGLTSKVSKTADSLCRAWCRGLNSVLLFSWFANFKVAHSARPRVVHRLQFARCEHPHLTYAKIRRQCR